MATRKPKTEKPTGYQQVNAFLIQLEHPLKLEIEAIRTFVLSAHTQLTEHIKWNAPSFQHNGEDRITFNLHAKNEIKVVFHCGAKARNNPVQGHLFEDTTGLLEWLAHDRAVATFRQADEIKNKEAALKKVINQWIESTSGVV